MKRKKVRVVRVTETEFKLSDGRAYQHFEKLDTVPTVAEFQEIYDYWFKILKGGRLVGKADRDK